MENKEPLFVGGVVARELLAPGPASSIVDGRTDQRSISHKEMNINEETPSYGLVLGVTWPLEGDNPQGL